MKPQHFEQQEEIHYNNYDAAQHHQVIPIVNKHQPIQPVIYPTLNINNESVQQEPVIHNQYIDQQKDYSQCTSQQQNSNNTITTPLIEPILRNVDTNYQNDEIITFQHRKELIMRINLCMLLQHTFQILLSSLVNISMKYAKLYFDYEERHPRQSFYIISAILLIFLVFIRFYAKIHRQKQQQIWIYIFYVLVYGAFSSGITACGQLSFHHGGWYLVMGATYYFGSIGILIVLIQFQFLIKSLDDDKMYLKSFINGLVAGPLSILFIISALFGIDIATIVLLFEIIYSIFFTLFYVPSLLQIYRGKFTLRRSQYYLGTIVTNANMLLLCIP